MYVDNNYLSGHVKSRDIGGGTCEADDVLSLSFQNLDLGCSVRQVSLLQSPGRL